ncbi:MAG: DUF2993 domain-containing protein [Crinalium sp.]
MATEKNQLGLEAQALSKVAEIGLSNQVDDVEKLDISVETDLLNMAQGKVDSVSMTAQGLVMQKDVRVQEIEMHTDKIAIDILTSLFGKIELQEPIDANGTVVVTETDINQTLNSDYIASKLAPLKLRVNDQIVSLELQQPIELKLSGDGKLTFSGDILLQETDSSRKFRFTGVVKPGTSTQPLLLEGFNCYQGEGISLDLCIALMQKCQELLKLPYLEIAGVAFRVKHLEVQQEKMTLQIETHIKQIPNDVSL